MRLDKGFLRNEEEESGPTSAEAKPETEGYCCDRQADYWLFSLRSSVIIEGLEMFDNDNTGAWLRGWPSPLKHSIISVF